MKNYIILKNLKHIGYGEVILTKTHLYYIREYFKLDIVKNILSQDNLTFEDFDILMNEWDYYIKHNQRLEDSLILLDRTILVLFLLNAGIRAPAPGFIQLYNQIKFVEGD